MKEIYLAIPKSLKEGDNRVSVPPHRLPVLEPMAWNNGRDKTKLKVLVEDGAGLRSGYTNEEYEQQGAKISTLSEILEKADILIDVKQRPKHEILENGINIFYAHVEKGQGIDQLTAFLESDNVTAYSPETLWINDNSGKLVRATNLGFFSGIGGVHMLFEGIKLSYEKRGVSPTPFSFTPHVDGASYQDMQDSYKNIGDLEQSLKFAIIAGKNGLVSTGSQHELDKAGLSYDFIYKDLTGNQDKLAEAISQYDGIINASLWNPGDQRMITKRQINAMKDGAVFVDNTCDPDLSSSKESEGDPIIGGVRYSFESKWGERNNFYWVGTEAHTFDQENPHEFYPDEVKVLYSAVGMIPGGTTTAKAAGDAYFCMISPYLANIVRAVSQGTQLPENGMVIKEGKIFHKGLRELVQTRKDLEHLQKYL